MKGKNLFDIEEEIRNIITFVSKQNETIISVEINQYTNNYLYSNHIYGFKNISTIINNDLSNFEIKINREKNERKNK